MCSNKEFLNPQISIEKEACLGRDTVVAIIEEGQKIKILNFMLVLIKSAVQLFNSF